MKKKLFILLLALPVLAFLLTGCAEGLTPASWSGIHVDDANIYIAAGPQVYKLELESGRELWRFPEKGNPQKPFYAEPVLTPDGQLIVGGYDKILYSLDPDNGQPRQGGSTGWPFTGAKDRWIGSVLVVNERIYAPNADHKLYILNLDGELQGEPFQADNALWAAPVTDGTNVYFTSLSSTVYALNAQTGDRVWERKIDGALLGGIVISPDGVLITGSFSGVVKALNPVDGKTIWERELPSQIWSTPTINNGILYIGTSTGMVFTLNAETGRDEWEFQADSAVLGSPLVLENKIVFGTELSSLYFVDRNTLEEEVETLTGKLYGTPVLAGERILVAPVNGDFTLLAFDFDGKQDWTFKPGK